jgi:hypothetical protein
LRKENEKIVNAKLMELKNSELRSRIEEMYELEKSLSNFDALQTSFILGFKVSRKMTNDLAKASSIAVPSDTYPSVVTDLFLKLVPGANAVDAIAKGYSAISGANYENILRAIDRDVKGRESTYLAYMTNLMVNYKFGVVILTLKPDSPSLLVDVKCPIRDMPLNSNIVFVPIFNRVSDIGISQYFYVSNFPITVVVKTSPALLLSDIQAQLQIWIDDKSRVGTPPFRAASASSGPLAAASGKRKRETGGGDGREPTIKRQTLTPPSSGFNFDASKYKLKTRTSTRM